MAEKTKIEVSLILPQGSDCQACLGRLQQAVQRYHGVEVTHLDDEGDRPRLCIHYDPASASPDYLRAIAAEEGAILAWRYRHETLAIEGMDCPDCARTLETGVGRLDGVLSASANFAAETPGGGVRRRAGGAAGDRVEGAGPGL